MKSTQTPDMMNTIDVNVRVVGTYFGQPIKGKVYDVASGNRTDHYFVALDTPITMFGQERSTVMVDFIRTEWRSAVEAGKDFLVREDRAELPEVASFLK